MPIIFQFGPSEAEAGRFCKEVAGGPDDGVVLYKTSSSGGSRGWRVVVVKIRLCRQNGRMPWPKALPWTAVGLVGPGGTPWLAVMMPSEGPREASKMLNTPKAYAFV